MTAAAGATVGAVLALGGFGALAGALLGRYATWAGRHYRAVDRVDALLPQTQCGECGYAGCRPYAEAIVAGRAEINRCPPGGERTIDALADLLGRERMPLDPALPGTKPPRVVIIDEARCIGCTKCIAACPVDAIVGAAKRMHTVLADRCTGCELCIAPCPVDCIDVAPLPAGPQSWRWPKP